MGKGNYVAIVEDDSTTVIFCLPEKVGVLADALRIFQVSEYYLTYQESESYLRPIMKTKIYNYVICLNNDIYNTGDTLALYKKFKIQTPTFRF